MNQDNVVVVGEAALKASGKSQPSCNAKKAMGFIYVDPKRAGEIPQPCSELVYPYQRFLVDQRCHSPYLAAEGLSGVARCDGSGKPRHHRWNLRYQHRRRPPFGLRSRPEGLRQERWRQSPAGRHGRVLRNLRRPLHHASGPTLLPDARSAVQKAPRLLHLADRHLPPR